MSCGMGGIRTTGDLVAWVQLAKKLRINEAKAYVAEKLGLSLADLTDPYVAYAARQRLGLGNISPEAGENMGILAKRQTAKVLDLTINSVRLMNSKL